MFCYDTNCFKYFTDYSFKLAPVSFTVGEGVLIQIPDKTPLDQRDHLWIGEVCGVSKRRITLKWLTQSDNNLFITGVAVPGKAVVGTSDIIAKFKYTISKQMPIGLVKDLWGVQNL